MTGPQCRKLSVLNRYSEVSDPVGPFDSPEWLVSGGRCELQKHGSAQRTGYQIIATGKMVTECAVASLF